MEHWREKSIQLEDVNVRRRDGGCGRICINYTSESEYTCGRIYGSDIIICSRSSMLSWILDEFLVVCDHVMIAVIRALVSRST